MSSVDLDSDDSCFETQIEVIRLQPRRNRNSENETDGLGLSKKGKNERFLMQSAENFTNPSNKNTVVVSGKE